MNRKNASAMNGLLRTTLVTILSVAVGIVGLAGSVRAGQQVFSASGTFTPPAGVTSVNVQVWGGGGGGAGDGTNNTVAGAGGGGGGYAKKANIAVSGGTSVVVGAAGAAGATTNGTGGTGGDSYFNNTTTVRATGGTGGVNGGAGGTGGAGVVGDVLYTGGNGSANVATAGGGGGGSAGTAGNGNTVTASTTGATAVAGGGPGGNGGTAGNTGSAPATGPGGGGGGAGNRTGGSRAGGAGAVGQVIVGYGPTVTTTKDAGQADPTNVVPVSFTVTFSEEITGFTAADVSLSGSATGKSVTAITPIDLVSYTVTVTATGGGDISISIPAGGVQDTFGNNNFASTPVGDNTVTYTTASNPTVTINQAGAQPDPTNGTIDFTVVFSESVTGFTGTDVTLSGTAPASVTNVSGSGTTYTVTVTATDSGTVIADVNAGAATGSGSGLLNVASTSTDNIVTFDNLKPDPTIDLGGGQPDTDNTLPITFSVVFNENVTGFVAGDVTLSGTAANLAVQSVSGSGATYTVTVYDPAGNPVATNGTVIISIGLGAATDTAGNTSNAAIIVDNEVNYTGAACADGTPSTITIPGSQTVGGLGVILTSLYSTTGNVGAFSYTINAVPVGSPWDSSTFGTTGPEVVTFAVSGIDPDCGTVVSQSNTITVDNSSLNFLMHNSQITGSSKWPIAQSGKAVDGWGIASAQYGQFECGTCHTRATTNVKRIKTTLTAPTDTFPIGAGTVQLLTVADGSSQYGDDSAAGRTLGVDKSNRICEGCHSKNKFHNYNSNLNVPNGGTLTHANQSDCMTCHPHKQGFKSPGCNSCHGEPPISPATLVFSPSPTGATFPDSPGAHGTHAVTKAMRCETCHTGNTMPTVSDTIEMGILANATNVAGFNGSVAGGTMNVPQDANLTNGYTYVSSDGGVTTVTKQNIDNPTCTVYCHGNWANDGGSIASPAWVGTNQAVCGACHGATPAAPPQTGSHNTHVLNTGNVKLACNKCHLNYTDTAHLDGNVAWQLATADARIGASATYTAFGKSAAASGTTGNKAPSSTYGTCSVYCHGSNTPTWGGANINCDGCHTASSILEGSHAKHYDPTAAVATGNTTTNSSTASAYIFQCGTCHNAASTAHAGGPVSGIRSAEVSLSGGGTYTAGGAAAAGSPDGVFSYTAGTCGFNACHNDGKATAGSPRVVAQWTVALPANCTGCHYGDSTSGFPMATNAHGVHVSDGTVMTIKPCQMCHDATVDADNRVVTDKSKHVNGARDLAILGTWDSDATPTNNWNGTQCSNVYCHSNGQAVATRNYQTIAWNTTIGCTGCHGGAGVTTTLSNSHKIHIGTDASDTNKQFGYACDVCHVQTASGSNAIGTPANHINTVRDVAVKAANGGTGTNDTDYVGYVLPDTDPRYGVQAIYTCANVNCHGSGSPDWSAGTANDGNCQACHGYTGSPWEDTNNQTDAGDSQVGAHAVHLNASSGYSAPVTCDACHLVTKTAVDAQTTYVNKVRAAGHIDSVVPAELTWSSLSTKGGELIPGYNQADGKCTQVYCHGAGNGGTYQGLLSAGDPTPLWTNSTFLTGTIGAADCTRCHGAPPLGKGHEGTEPLTACGNAGCHDATMNEGFATFKDVSKHVNGVVDNSAVCSSCHTQMPPAQGSHPKHGMHLIQDIGMSDGNPLGTLADWTAANYPTCSICHDMTVQSNHLVVPGQIYMMGPAKADQRFSDEAPGYPDYNFSTQSCTNAKCHFKPTPDWEP